jgi:hypothetical protein
MNIKDYLLNRRYSYLITAVIIYFTYQSCILYLHVYDGHHHGLMFSNALDLINGKLPYKEIFIQYGLVTTIIHSIVLLVFEKNIYFINLITIFIYFGSLLLVYLITKKFTNQFYAFTAFIALLFNHPTPWLPWSNYIAFFFVLLAIYLFTKMNKYSSFLLGFFLCVAGLSRLDFFAPIIFSLIIFGFIIFFQTKKHSGIKLVGILLGFLVPITTFIFYLFFNNIFFIWVEYLKIPSIYLKNFNTNIFSLSFIFFNFFLTESLINFIVKPQYLLIFTILLSNTFFLVSSFRKKDFISFLISLLSVLLSIVSLNTELFRLYSSVSIGVISYLYLIYMLDSPQLRKILLILIYIPSFFSVIFYPHGNNSNFKTYIKHENYISSEINLFKYQKWPIEKVKSLTILNNFKNQLMQNCKVEYADNLTFDVYYQNILGLNRTRLFPFLKNDKNGFILDDYFNKNFIQKIKDEIVNENIILLVPDDSLVFDSEKIFYNTNYSYYFINLNSSKNKPELLRFYYPTKCNIKS